MPDDIFTPLAYFDRTDGSGPPYLVSIRMKVRTRPDSVRIEAHDSNIFTLKCSCTTANPRYRLQPDSCAHVHEARRALYNLVGSRPLLDGPSLLAKIREDRPARFGDWLKDKQARLPMPAAGWTVNA